MSSLPLLNGDVSIKSGDTAALMCSPAVLVIVVGVGMMLYNVSRGNLNRIGAQMLGTMTIAAVVALLCFAGLKSVGWMVALLPVIIVGSLVIVVMLTLMLTGDGKAGRHHHKQKPSRPVHPPKEPSMSDAYRYVMTGKGFAWF